jgi:thioredoxin-like negative regulator of GroEL
MPELEPESLKCPTCGARQEPSPECRRCHCDLTPVVAVLEQREKLQQETLGRLRAGRFADAVHTARRRWATSTDGDAARLLAVCYLLDGRFQAALDVYDRAQAADCID